MRERKPVERGGNLLVFHLDGVALYGVIFPYAPRSQTHGNAPDRDQRNDIPIHLRSVSPFQTENIRAAANLQIVHADMNRIADAFPSLQFNTLFGILQEGELPPVKRRLAATRQNFRCERSVSGSLRFRTQDKQKRPHFKMRRKIACKTAFPLI